MKVLKPFKTRLSKFAEGSTIAADQDFAPHTLDGLIKGKFVEASPKVAEKAAEKVADDPADEPVKRSKK
jgi:hypothetical protein